MVSRWPMSYEYVVMPGLDRLSVTLVCAMLVVSSRSASRWLAGARAGGCRRELVAPRVVGESQGRIAVGGPG